MSHQLMPLAAYLATLRPTAFRLIVLSMLAACSHDGWNDQLLRDAGAIATEDADAEDAGPTPLARCVPAMSSEALPARSSVVTGVGSGATRAMYLPELFATFKTHCGDCHADGRNNGGFDVKLTDFADKMDEEVLGRIRSEDANTVMPRPIPGGPSRFSEREENDPVVRFAALLDQWLAERKPAVFYPTAQDGSTDPSSDSPYRVSADVAMNMTNLGNCVPTAQMPRGDKAQSKTRELDERFAAVTRFEDLPKRLRETDLVTLDASVLAEHGVYAFAPAYTLWADYAKKVRFVRVPVGESIRFDKDTQSFEIPPNTRFYKTFFKRVIDLHGNERYRKMETRLIIARPDAPLADGEDYEPAAVFGTYEWNEEETEATLLDEPYRDGKGFSDHVETYVVDERLEDQVLRERGDDFNRMLELGATRHYAIPGFDRCVHCHMGAPGRNFILGFIPLQIHRRPLGEGGVVEPAEEHELTQLQRLIDYGVISGMAGPEDVVLLEKSQADREPRNEHELKAQGYMLGNCAHCHNPSGFPSLREKVLADTLDFLPSPTGGIFEFPLDKFSPRTFRGPDQDIRVPYITPSLFDHPLALQANRRANDGSVMQEGQKWIVRKVDAVSPEDYEAQATLLFPTLAALDLRVGRPLLAPWRSLIYRNVDAPFSYEDGATIFPHMPMDTPGYDCRARRLLGNWMVSIPAHAVPAAVGDFGEMADATDQPYSEILPDDPQYEDYRAKAEQRLERFRNGERYHDCPAAELDVVAPEVASSQSLLPKAQVTTVNDDDGNAAEEYSLLSPARPHYAKTDLRDDRTWIVRRDDWYQVLVELGYDPPKREKGGTEAEESDRAIAAVRTLKLTDQLREFALKEVPFGLWASKDACDAKLAAQPKAEDFKDAARPRWMEIVDPEPAAPVYTISPGAQVFGMVCSKCHGPDATGTSTLASTIADLTGGLTRVANLRDGVFGPLGDRGAHRQQEYSQADGQLGGSTEDWAARYMVWMGLGGTNAAIPKTVLTQIGSAKLLGESRKASLGTIDAKSAANMLTVAKEACARLLPKYEVSFDPLRGGLRARREDPKQQSLEEMGLIPSNGDAELWEVICRFDNPQPIRVLDLASPADSTELVVRGAIDRLPGDDPEKYYISLYRNDGARYPSDAEIGDQTGRVVTGLQPDNLAPWCVRPGQNPDQLAKIESARGERLPICDSSFVDIRTTPPNNLSEKEGAEWSVRGAANAGLAVYLYLDALASGRVAPKPAFDRCEDL